MRNEPASGGVNSPRKPCLRCLLAEMAGSERLRASLRELIDLIPPEDRTPPEERDRRLQACRACENLGEGTCRLCGCYVEHRAERKGSRCPAVPARWP